MVNTVVTNPRFFCFGFRDTIFQKIVVFEDFEVFNANKRTLRSKNWKTRTKYGYLIYILLEFASIIA